MKMRKRNLWYSGIIIVLVFIALYFVVKPGSKGNYDEFAQCLTDKGAKMYGAYWCSHCNAQKEEFGSSWEYVSYVECSPPNGQGQTAECSTAGIRGYPTWEFADGTRLEGEQSLNILSQKTGCPLEFSEVE